MKEWTESCREDGLEWNGWIELNEDGGQGGGREMI